jgi:ABC-type glycerol-3-phosphate transport system substrate-binding protein
MSRRIVLLIVFGLYLLAAIAVFVASLLFPQFRAVAYAPLRELVLPPPAPIVVQVLYSTEKEEWLNEVVPAFEATNPQVDGHPVQLKLEKSGSREIVLALLNGEKQPDLISPASSLQISILQDQSPNVFGQAIVNAADTGSCRSVLRTPLVLVAWKERAAVLWGNDPDGRMWSSLHDAAIDPQGWATYGHPEWGYIKFGHTDPLRSNSGFQAIVLMTYSYFNKTSGLTSADILSDPGYQKWFLELEDSISEFGNSTGDYMKDMIAFGPSKYDLVAVYESVAIEQAANAVSRYGELQVYYPPATSWSDHPFCIVNANWVTPEKQQAARLFLDYLVSRPAQEAAFLKYGFRPVDASIQLDQPGSPFLQYAGNGIRLDLPPEAQTPPGDVLNSLLEFWTRNVRQ